MGKKTRHAAYAAKGNAPAAVPVNTAVPMVSGTAQEGQTLSSTQGSWTGSPTSFAYQWRRCNSSGASCSDIAAATSSTYAQVTADVGSTLRSRVTATNGVGATTADSTQTGVVAAVTPPSLITNNIVALLGDSRVAHVDGAANPSAGFMHHNGFCLWARRYSGGAIQFNRAHQFAVGGYSTADVINNKLAACAASDAESVILMVGVNDWGKGLSTATTLTNINTIVNTLTGSGKAVFICDEAPAIGHPNEASHIAIRDYIRGLNGANIYVVPSWDAAAESPNSSTPGPGYADTVHFGPEPASEIGRVTSTAMVSRLPAFDLWARSGVLSGGDYTGTGGSKVGGVTGNVPNGWTVALEAGTGTVVCSIVASGGYNWLVVALTNGSAPRIGIYTGDLDSGWTAGTDILDMAVKCKIDAGSANIIMCQLYSVDQNGTRLSLSNGNGAYDGAIINSATVTLSPEAMDFTMWMPHVVYPLGATSFNQRMEIRGLASTTSSGVFRFALPQLRKYTGTLNDSGIAPGFGGLVQKANPIGAATASTLTSNTLATTPVSGRRLMFGVTVRSNSNVTINTPSGWTAGPAVLNSDHVRVALFYKIAGASEPTTVTVTTSAQAGAIEMCGPYEFSGFAGAIESAVSNTSTGSSLNPTVTGAAATTDGTELVVAYHGQQGNQTASGTSTTWTLVDTDAEDGGDANSRVGGHFAFKILTANETPTNLVQTGGPVQFASLVTAFKAA